MVGNSGTTAPAYDAAIGTNNFVETTGNTDFIIGTATTTKATFGNGGGVILKLNERVSATPLDVQPNYASGTNGDFLELRTEVLL